MRQQTWLGWFHHDVTHRGITAWLLSAAILGFYIVLYFGHRLPQGHWNTAEHWVFVLLLVGIVVVGGYMIWCDSQEPEELRKQQLPRTLIGVLATLVLAGFVYAIPASMKYLGQTSWAKSLSGLEWGTTGNLAFQLLYGATAGLGLLALISHRKAQQQPMYWFRLFALLLAALVLILFLGAFLIRHTVDPQKFKVPTYSLFHGIKIAATSLQWVFLGIGIMFFGGWGALLVRSKRSTSPALPIPQANQRFVGMVMLLSLLFCLIATIHATPAFFGALYKKHDPFDVVAMNMGLDSKWMLYGLLYTVAITGGGAFMIWKYWHNRYQIVRTTVVMFVQVTLAFSIPWIFKLFQRPDYYFSYIWPLKIDYFYPSTIAYQINQGLPVPIVVYSFVAGLVIAPFLGIWFGKRWYCSWVCGCGGLANTFGEPWRHLSNKSSKAWWFEKISIHLVLVLTLALTALSLISHYWLPSHKALTVFTQDFRGLYGLGVSAVLSGVVGVGLYPLGGTRVWCRFACPMAALLGLLQKLGRFRIRVKRDMCISCGLCSKYCEMGIDVRSYAQSNENFTRASCVGCGLCSEVCPRGVLRLENVPRTRS